MEYIDSFANAIPNDKRDVYLERASKLWPLFKEQGALRMVENWGEQVPDGERTSYLKAVQCAEGETVVLSWIVWPSKAARDAGMAAVRGNERTKELFATYQIDGKRMIFGGFETVFNSDH